MFTFEDLRRLDAGGAADADARGRQGKAPLALKGASREAAELFFGNMSERAAKILQRRHRRAGPGAAARRG